MEEKKLEDFLPDKKSSYIKKFNNSNTYLMDNFNNKTLQ